MFVDAHTKVFSLLLDAVCELLLVHWQQLKDWLYQLMFRFVSQEIPDLRLIRYEVLVSNITKRVNKCVISIFSEF